MLMSWTGRWVVIYSGKIEFDGTAFSDRAILLALNGRAPH